MRSLKFSGSNGTMRFSGRLRLGTSTLRRRDSIPDTQGGPVHDIGHPQCIGQVGLESLGRTAALRDAPRPIEPFAPAAEKH
jgi:hypothetical protein